MAAKKEGSTPKEPHLEVTLKRFHNVVIKDVDKAVADSGKWPFVIDMTGNVGTFLRHRDAVYLNCLEQNDMQPDRIRMGILGALRHGHPFVLDLLNLDMLEAAEKLFDQVQPGLMASIMDRSILQEEKFAPLIKESDGEDYVANKFSEFYTSQFKFVVVTTNENPPEKMFDQFFVVKVE